MWSFRYWVSFAISTQIFFVSFAAAADNVRCQSKLYNLTVPEGYFHTKYAPAPIDRLYEDGAFVASIDGSDDNDSLFQKGDVEGEYTLQPEWVAYHMKAYVKDDGMAGYAPGWKRPGTWYRADIFDEERAHFGEGDRVDASYAGVGRTWNRGHLAQRADANRLGPEYGCNTHVFANAFPQHAKFNQGIWLGLENYLAGLANQVGEIWIITGPVFTGVPETIGDDDELPVSVPQAAFKIAVWEEEGNPKTLSFVYPNTYPSPNYQSGRCYSDGEYDHQPYFTSIADIENLTRLTFPVFDDQHKRKHTYELPEVAEMFRIGACR